MSARAATEVATGHQIVSCPDPSLLMDWVAEFLQESRDAGRKVIFAPAQALAGSVSLRGWIELQARALLGGTRTTDAPTLLAGAADTLVIMELAAADAPSLSWLASILGCVVATRDMAALPPLPQIVVPTSTLNAPGREVAQFLEKLRELGAEETAIKGRAPEPRPEFTELLDRNDDLLAALLLSPVPFPRAALEEVIQASGSDAISADDILQGAWFKECDNAILPVSADVATRMRRKIPSYSIGRGSALLVPVVEKHFPELEDLTAELIVRFGETRRASRIARERFDQHIHAGRLEEALRLAEAAMAVKIPLSDPDRPGDFDQVRLASLQARTGRHEKGGPAIKRLMRNRANMDDPEIVEWLALGACEAALRGAFDMREADALLRRAIRMNRGDYNHSTGMLLMRIGLIDKEPLNLHTRARWLVAQFNRKQLRSLSAANLATFYEVAGAQALADGNVRTAYRRLRRVPDLSRDDSQQARSLLMLARCRTLVEDSDGARRFASAALTHALRAADPERAEGAVEMLKEVDKVRRKSAPETTNPPVPKRGKFPPLTSIQAAKAPEPAEVFAVLQSRFGARQWIRRRGRKTTSLGKGTRAAVGISIFDAAEGTASRVATAGSGQLRAVSLLRDDGSDFVLFTPGPDPQNREDLLVRFLLSDTAADIDEASHPGRRAVIGDYYRRAMEHGVNDSLLGGLHRTMERLFNKDLLLYFEEEGFTLDELADMLSLSRATLYRMYQTAGLSI